MEKSFAMISLGCAKNLVNSEQMLYLMSEAGYIRSSAFWPPISLPPRAAISAE